LERLTANDKVATRNSPGFNPSIFRHSGILGAVYEEVLNKVHENPDQNGCKKVVPLSTTPTTIKLGKFFSQFFMDVIG
jgi:hypothetical protein